MTTPHSSDPLAERIMERIEKEGVRPTPRWVFLSKNYTFWALGALAVILGAFAFSAALFEVENAGWGYFAATHGSFFSFFLAVAPFLWVAVLALFILLGYVNIRRTKRGYRYPLLVIALGAVLTSVSLGSGLYAAGLGAELEEVVGDHPPLYRPILTEERVWWQAPQKGLLAGDVVSASSGATAFVLKDFSGKEWQVDGAEVDDQGLAVIARGGAVRVIGVPTAATSSALHACYVFPWRVYGIYDDSVTPPVALLSTTSEIKAGVMRTQLCKDIHPYLLLRRTGGGVF